MLKPRNGMKGNLKTKGHYKLFETTKGHRILVLNNKDWYAMVKSSQGQLLVHSDSDHKAKETIQEGDFYLADFENDPQFNDVPNLFLEQGSNFKEYILPNGLPTGKDTQKKLVEGENVLSKEKVKRHVG